jgi:hypothetical protein
VVPKRELSARRYKYATLSFGDITKESCPSGMVDTQIRQQGYCHAFWGACTRGWQRWQGPVTLVRVNYRPVLSSERSLHKKNKNSDCPTVIQVWSWAPGGCHTPRPTGRLSSKKRKLRDRSYNSSSLVWDGRQPARKWRREQNNLHCWKRLPSRMTKTVTEGTGLQVTVIWNLVTNCVVESNKSD